MADEQKTYSAGARALAWDDLEVILAVCRTESLSGAARVLGVNHSTVSRRINAIEDRSGVRFFDRMPGGYYMTDEGRTAMEHAERIEAEVNELSLKVLGRDTELSGHVRLTCSEGLAVELVPRMIANFCRQHPRVSVDVAPLHGQADLTRREAEVAIRFTRAPPESAFGRKVGDLGTALYSSPAYLERMRDVPVTEHDWCFVTATMNWIVPQVFSSVAQAEQRTVMHSRAPHGVCAAVAAGMGTMPMACHLADADPRLVRISENFAHLGLGVWVLTHSDLRRTARIRALMAHLADEMAAERARFAGEIRAGGTQILFP